MPDSWIDKEELDELVGSFSTLRKGRKRRLPISVPMNERVETAGETRVSSESSQPGNEEPDGAAGSEPREENSITEENSPEISTALEVEHFVQVMEVEVESEPVSSDEAEEIEDDPAEAEVTGEKIFEIESEPVSTCGVEVLEEDPTGVQGEIRVEIDEKIAAPEMASSEEIVEIVLEDEMPGELREVPEFLDDRVDIMPTRLPSLSERDADRAHLALADARSRVEKSQLLRIRREDHVFPEPSEIEDFEEFEVISPEFDPGVDAINPTETISFPEAIADFSDKETLDERIERFSENAKEILEAIEVAVCDRDGFLLHSFSENVQSGALETASLLEVSGRTSRLLGIGNSRATQVSAGGGIWRCLIRGEGEARDLFAGFCLRRPLDQNEIEFWTSALAEVVEPSPLLH